MSTNKMGFWSVLALVIATQLGSGAFFLPSTLAQFGWYSLIGWFITATCAISLAVIFAKLCAKFPETGGPHIYILNIFGKKLGFFVGWSYWLLSSVSSAAVIISCIGYLSPLIGLENKIIILFSQLFLLLMITLLNLRGVIVTSKAEFFLTILRIIPLIIIPLCSLPHISMVNFAVAKSVEQMSVTSILSKVVLLTFWGFVGIETATTPAGSVQNPSKTIPKAIITGASIVGLVYFFNNLSILGVVGSEKLINSKAPYVDAANIIFSNTDLGIAMSVIASVICISTLNAWTLASYQILIGLAEKKLMPPLFMKNNKYGVASISVLASVSVIVPILLITMNQDYANQLTTIIDFSVIVFLFIYLLCSLALLKLLIIEKRLNYFLFICILVATGLCSFIIYNATYKTLSIALLFMLSGLPIYFIISKQKETSEL